VAAASKLVPMTNSIEGGPPPGGGALLRLGAAGGPCCGRRPGHASRPPESGMQEECRLRSPCMVYYVYYVYYDY
jgi:hypothetical protein